MYKICENNREQIENEFMALVLNKNEVIERYNETIVPKLQDLGIEINDLYSLVSKQK